VQENYAQLSQDVCSRQLVLGNLCNYDLKEEMDIFCRSSSTINNTASVVAQNIQIEKEMNKSLFLRDCLKTFATSNADTHAHQIKQHENTKKIDDNDDENEEFRLKQQNELNYEIDMSDEIENKNSPDQEKRLKRQRKKAKKQLCQEDVLQSDDNDGDYDDTCDPYLNKKEKNGWLMYKMISSLDKDINKVCNCLKNYLNFI